MTSNRYMSPVSGLFDQLVAHFDGELERQELVLGLSRAQGDAARAHDTVALQARTEALTTMFEEAALAEQKRMPLLKALVEHYELTREQQTLTGLIDVAPEPWKHRLAEFQQRLRAVTSETKSVVVRNTLYIRRSLKTIDVALTMLTGNEDAVSAGYCGTGADTSPDRARTPARIDTKG